MFIHIQQNMHRQFKGLELLSSLLEEEFQYLLERNTDAITAIEFSIHELLRQLAVERIDLKETMQGTTLLEYAGLLPEEDGESIRKYYHLIDALEQSCARQASQNAELSLAFLDQGQELLRFLHNQITPKRVATYSATGTLKQERLDAALITGRL